jgi:hypothetical protein
MSDLPISTIKSMVFGDNMNLGEPEVDDDAPNPMAEFMHRAQVAAAVKSAGGTSVLLDLPVPDLNNDVDEEGGEFWRAPKVIKYQPNKTSGTKFIELLALIRKVFASDEELMAEAVEIVTRARDEERAATIADIAAR